MRHRKPENFLAAVARNGHGLCEEEKLAAREAADEALVMGLRLTEGIDRHALAERFGVPIVDESTVNRLARSGHLTVDGDRIQATPAGRLLLDRLLAELAV
jgi:oxygen-independent coproporphyrinogen-3 oxidase